MTTNNKGLGRGLGSLLGIWDNEQVEKQVSDKKSQDSVKKTEINSVEIGKIDVNPNQPRKNFDATALKELAQSIKEHGVIQPVILSPRGDRYILVAGERRFRASKMAGLKSVPAVVREYTDNQIKEIALLENIQREDLNPIETARAMKELIESFDWTQDVLADRLGKSRPAVANFLRLLTLSPAVVAMVESGKLSAGHARALVVVSDPDVQLKLAELAVHKHVTVRDLERAVKEQNAPHKAKRKATPSAEMKEFVDIMEHKFRTKVGIIGNEKHGRIYIDYYSQDDLDRIYEIVNSIR